MPYSIPGSTKILIYIYIYFGNSTIFLILVGTLCVCEFADAKSVHFTVSPRKERYTLLPTH